MAHVLRIHALVHKYLKIAPRDAVTQLANGRALQVVENVCAVETLPGEQYREHCVSAGAGFGSVPEGSDGCGCVETASQIQDPDSCK